jgi:hypothetical protein
VQVQIKLCRVMQQLVTEPRGSSGSAIWPPQFHAKNSSLFATLSWRHCCVCRLRRQELGSQCAWRSRSSCCCLHSVYGTRKPSSLQASQPFAQIHPDDLQGEMPARWITAALCMSEATLGNALLQSRALQTDDTAACSREHQLHSTSPEVGTRSTYNRNHGAAYCLALD